MSSSGGDLDIRGVATTLTKMANDLNLPGLTVALAKVAIGMP
jgi:hypothetical protein